MFNKKVNDASELTENQVNDIKSREKEALEILTRLQLTPAAYIVKEKVGSDVFADKVVPYLRDVKYLR